MAMTGVILTPRKAGLHIAKPHVHSDHWYNKGDRCKPQIYGRKGNFEGWDCGNTIRKLSSPKAMAVSLKFYIQKVFSPRNGKRHSLGTVEQYQLGGAPLT